MWILESTTQPEENTYSILGDHKYVVGRQNCDIIVADPSVSRKQAVLTMAHYETNVAKSFVLPTLTLEDVSKFGTYVNGKPVKTAGGNTVTLKENDLIKFGGTPASVYRARYQPFLATTSCLEKGPKKALQRVMCLLGGHLVRDWRPTCDLLIMSKINVTLKVICAINNQKHIVIPKYLDDLQHHLMGHAEKPDPEKYLPEVVDQEVPPGVSFHPNKKRQTLLEGLKFYFLSPLQFNKTNLAVSTAGGQPILLEDGNEEDAETMTQEGTVVVLVTKDVMDTLSPASTKFVRTVMATLKRKNLRMITDPEIGTAILTCNMVDYCNPRTALAPNLQAAMANQIMSQMTDVESSQVKVVSAAQHASRDIKPDIRSVSNKQMAETSKQQGKISLSTNSAVSNIAKPAASTVDISVLPAEDKKPVVFLQTPLVTSPKKSKAIKTQDLGKESIASSSVLYPPSLQSNDLFGDVSVANESTPRSSVSETVQQNIVPEDKEDENVPSVFARQRMKKQSNSRFCEDDEVERGSRQQKRKFSLFDEEEETNSSKQSRKFTMFGDEEDSKSSKQKGKLTMFDEEEEAISSKERKRFSLLDDPDEDIDKTKTMKTKSLGGSKRKFSFGDDNDEDSAYSKVQKKNGDSKNNQIIKEMGVCSDLSDQDNLVSTFSVKVFDSAQTEIEKRQETRVLSFEDESDPGNSKTRADKCNPKITTDGDDKQSSSATFSVPPRLGWVSAAAKKRSSSKTYDEHDDTDVKPDKELIRDAAGNILRNLCEVELAELVVRQGKPKSKVYEDGGSKNGTQKNFKCFKKTENAGAGKLPIIIGGRDLEEHRGTVHKDLEDLFTKGLARQNEEDEEERQNRDLFDWDTKNRKPSNRRIR